MGVNLQRFTGHKLCFWYVFEYTSHPEFEKHIPDIYPTELQLNKANTSDKETSVLDLNIKVIGSDVIPAFKTNAMTSDFLSLFSLVEW